MGYHEDPRRHLGKPQLYVEDGIPTEQMERHPAPGPVRHEAPRQNARNGPTFGHGRTDT